MFKSVSPKLDVSSMEENVLKLWKKAGCVQEDH